MAPFLMQGNTTFADQYVETGVHDSFAAAGQQTPMPQFSEQYGHDQVPSSSNDDFLSKNLNSFNIDGLLDNNFWLQPSETTGNTQNAQAQLTRATPLASQSTTHQPLLAQSSSALPPMPMYNDASHSQHPQTVMPNISNVWSASTHPGAQAALPLAWMNSPENAQTMMHQGPGATEVCPHRCADREVDLLRRTARSALCDYLRAGGIYECVLVGQAVTDEAIDMHIAGDYKGAYKRYWRQASKNSSQKNKRKAKRTLKQAKSMELLR